MVGATEGKPFQQEQWGKNSQNTAANNGYPNSADYPVGEDGDIMEGVADGHIAIKGHGQQHRRFHKGEHMDEKYLCKASFKADLTNVEPEELHDCGQGGEGEAQVSEGQHGEKLVHGLVEGWL